MTVLQADRLIVGLGGRSVLEDVSLSVGPGEIVGLLGANGSGKSTLLKTVAGLLRPSAGKVVLDGRDLGSAARRDVARVVGYLPQAARSDWPLAVRHVVELGRVPFLSPLRALTPADRDAVDRALTLTDCTGLAVRPVTSLSGGERTRVMIARILAGDPDLLLLDEPVTGLDPRYQLELMRLLVGLVHDGGSRRRGALVVLHDLTLAARFCDRVHLLRDGRTLASGRVVEALTPATIAEAFGVRPLMVDTVDGAIPIAWGLGA